MENSFIKKERPPANVMLRDDKRYLCLRIDLSHAFPRIRLVRQFRNDGAPLLRPVRECQVVAADVACAARDLSPANVFGSHARTPLPRRVSTTNWAAAPRRVMT